jgi:PAS domain S-box-containing protein
MQPFTDAFKLFFNEPWRGSGFEERSIQQVVPTCLLRITAQMLSVMTGLTPDTPAIVAVLPSAFCESTSSTVGFAGMYSGSVTIHCSTVLAGAVAARMAGSDSVHEYESVHDAMGELANVLAGEIKQLLSAGGLDIQLSTPSTVSGSHYLLSEAQHHWKITVCLQIEGEPLYVSLVAQRNSLLQAAAIELRSKREWLTLALEGGNLGLWEWNLVTGKAQYSKEWASMLGYHADDLIQDIATWESLIHPDDLPAVQAALQAHLAGHSTCYQMEHRLLNKAGVWCWMLARGKVMQRQDDGTPLLIAGTYLDISERKAMETSLRKSRKEMQLLNEQLEVRVTEEVRKNREKDSLLQHQEKLASIGQLAAGVAHEINNPMGFIMGNLNTMKQYVSSLQAFCQLVEETVPDSSRTVLQEARKQLDLDYVLDDLGPLLAESTEGAERVRRIVLDLKDFARPDDQTMQEADLNQLVRTTINMVRNELKYVAQLNLQLDEIPAITCHPQKINQVISNLLVNAAHAIQQQGIITIRSWHEEGNVLLSVTDTGEGIAPELRSRIFDPFFTTKEVGKGTGLGLSISYDIISKHNGEITVESQVGVGTTFTVMLPVGVA